MEKDDNKPMHEVYLDLYLLERGTSMPSFINFRRWLREEGYHLSLDDQSKVRIILDMYHIDWLQEAASKGGRYSQMYSHLLKMQIEKMAKEGSSEEPITITIDFKNEGENKI